MNFSAIEILVSNLNLKHLIPCFVFNNIERKVLDIFYFSRYTEQV